MPARVRHIAPVLLLALAGTMLGGCSSVNERLSAGVADTLPHWAGGLPADAPPRPGTPEYDAYMKERERQRLEPAPASANANASAPAQPANPAH